MSNGWFPGLLEGWGVRLEPLTVAHMSHLAVLVRDTALPACPYLVIPNVEKLRNYIDTALSDAARGGAVPYVVMRLVGEQWAVCGMTRCMRFAPLHKRMEIGGTWLAYSARGTHINAAAKLLLLTQVFDHMGWNRVEFVVHPDNLRSRQALEKLGAAYEATLRRYFVVHGQSCDAAMYSVTLDDWPVVKGNLKNKLQTYGRS